MLRCGDVLIDESEGSRGGSSERVYMPRKWGQETTGCRLYPRAGNLGRCQEFENWRGCENGSVGGMIYVTRAGSMWGRVRVRVGSQTGWVVLARLGHLAGRSQVGFKRGGLRRLPGFRHDAYLAAACGCGSGAWGVVGAAWMDRTPSGDSTDVTAAGSTPAGNL